MSSLIPVSAPFTQEQRAWLNGFVAGMMGIQSSIEKTDFLTSLDLTSETICVPTPEEEEGFPWHDSSLPIIQRMNLAEGQPIERRLMAAMAQLNCGSCGYICQTYSEAIASGDETNLTLCSPGGKETKQMLKKLLKENGAPEARHSSSTKSASRDYTRSNPFTAKLIESRPLNKESSAKDTRHVEIDLTGSAMQYQVGDALGVYPTNCDELVESIISAIGADENSIVTTPLGNLKPLASALREDCCLRDASDELLELLIDRAECDSTRNNLKQLLDEGPQAGFDVLDALQFSGGSSLCASEFVATLSPLNPRLYSIASSMKAVGDRVHLTIGKVVYQREGRVRKGVASTMFADRLDRGSPVRVFVQRNHGGFIVPSDTNIPIIMVGPGTGVAPFIAFLQERFATKSTGENWLFFGDQHESLDYLYAETLNSYRDTGLLTRIDTAFSRDGEHKVYVQDRLREQGAELYRWLERGAHFYVCGDVSRMAADVDRALKEVLSVHGKMTDKEAEQYVTAMSKSKRYVRDVY